MATPVGQTRPGVQYDVPSGLVTATGVLLGLFGLAYLLTQPEPLAVWAAEGTLVAAPAGAVAYGGYWIARHVPRAERWSLVQWYLAGTLVAGALVGGYVIAERIGGATAIEPVLPVLLGSLGGGFVALFASISTARNRVAVDFGRRETGTPPTAEPVLFSPDARRFAAVAAEPRSWSIIQTLLRAGEPLEVDDLAEELSAAEDEDPRAVLVDLTHARLPKLADRGLVEFDPEVGVVRAGGRLADAVDAGEEFAVATELTVSDRGDR